MVRISTSSSNDICCNTSGTRTDTVCLSSFVRDFEYFPIFFYRFIINFATSLNFILT